jgi:hypothetical protein
MAAPQDPRDRSSQLYISGETNGAGTRRPGPPKAEAERWCRPRSAQRAALTCERLSSAVDVLARTRSARPPVTTVLQTTPSAALT